MPRDHHTIYLPPASILLGFVLSETLPKRLFQENVTNEQETYRRESDKRRGGGRIFEGCILSAGIPVMSTGTPNPPRVLIKSNGRWPPVIAEGNSDCNATVPTPGLNPERWKGLERTGYSPPGANMLAIGLPEQTLVTNKASKRE